MRSRRGSAALETALVMPIVLALAFSLADWAWLLFQWESVRAAANAGVRIVSGAPGEGTLTDLARPAVVRHLDAMNIDGDAATVTADVVEEPYGQVVTVAVSVSYDPLFGLLVPTRTIGARASMPWYGWIYEPPPP